MNALPNDRSQTRNTCMMLKSLFLKNCINSYLNIILVMKNKNEILKHCDTTKARGRWPSLYDNQNQLSSVFFLNAMAVGITVGFAVLSFFRGIAR